MRKSIGVLGLLILLSGFTGYAGNIQTFTMNCSYSTTDYSSDAINVKDVKVYYFHATARCATCKAVEAVTKEALKEYYGDKVSFTSINREKDKDNALIKKHKVSGQTLLVIQEEKVVNLTNDAFLNARTKPAKFKKAIKKTIDSMLKE
ncbi:hypothetical protein KAJ27_24620 [bacterium]|nr:hypothetical protein [bacterium]